MNRTPPFRLVDWRPKDKLLLLEREVRQAVQNAAHGIPVALQKGVRVLRHEEASFFDVSDFSH